MGVEVGGKDYAEQLRSIVYYSEELKLSNRPRGVAQSDVTKPHKASNK